MSIHKVESYNDTPSYYRSSSKESLYLVCMKHKLNIYLFDFIKRLHRIGQKDPIPLEIKKSILVLKIMDKEYNNCKESLILKDIYNFEIIMSHGDLIKNTLTLIKEESGISNCIEYLENYVQKSYSFKY